MVFIANLNCTIIFMSGHGHCMFYYFQHACFRHRITPEILIKMKRFLAFGSLSSSEVENAMISDLIIVC